MYQIFEVIYTEDINRSIPVACCNAHETEQDAIDQIEGWLKYAHNQECKFVIMPIYSL